MKGEKIIDGLLDIWSELIASGYFLESLDLTVKPKIHPRGARIFAMITTKMRRGEYLIYGHTHEQVYVEINYKVANTGCWMQGFHSGLTIDHHGNVKVHSTFENLANHLQKG